jgi:hypothetical protein
MHALLARWATPLAAAAALAGAASAQAPHLIPPLQRGLHERAAGAEIAVIARVTGADAGRLELAAEAVLRGAPPQRFAVKRSPLRPPPLAVGDRALLFLRGARPPYVLAGDASDPLPIASEAEARRLGEALPALLAAGDDAAALRAIYTRWSAADEPLLRRLGHEGLASLPPEAPAPGAAHAAATRAQGR